MYRQGDVLIIKASEIPKGVRKEKPQNGRLVLAEGEATGHAHAISAKHAMMYMLGTAMYIRALREAEIEHEEHATIRLPAGDYHVIRQQEYTPEGLRYVAD